jgi:hypothetical protein
VKYVVVESPNGEVPVLFPRGFLHRYVAQLFAPMPVVGAGFVRLRDGLAECYGVSSGLKIGARPVDSILVNEALADDGIPGARG